MSDPIHAYGLTNGQPDPKEDWTKRLTEDELQALEFGLDIGYCTTEDIARTVAALRALVGEIREAGEYLMQDIGPCADAGASCSQHPWAGIARCSARDFGAALALTEDDIRKRLE